MDDTGTVNMLPQAATDQATNDANNKKGSAELRLHDYTPMYVFVDSLIRRFIDNGALSIRAFRRNKACIVEQACTALSLLISFTRIMLLVCSLIDFIDILPDLLRLLGEIIIQISLCLTLNSVSHIYIYL